MKRGLLCGAAFCAAFFVANGALAQTTGTRDTHVFAQRLKKQEDRIAEYETELRDLRLRLEAIRVQSDNDLSRIRAGQTPAAALPGAPVGEKPAAEQTIQDVTALPEGMNVLAAPGSIIITPSAEYTRSASNRLVFRGVQIVPGIQLGLVDANTVASDLAVTAFDARFGVLPGFEMEVRLPYAYQHQTLTTVQQQVVAGQAPFSLTQNLEGNGIGDAEILGRYQINRPSNNEPIYIASFRLKTPTGRGPFDVNFNSAGIATSLPTGTGFWSMGPGVTIIIPSDPVVLFGSLGYLHTFAKDINKTIGTTPVGKVSPGDSVDLALGFGFAVNSRFSFSLGYSHSMILPTTTMLGTTEQRSQTLQAGSLALGWSYQFSDRFVINNNFQFGVTSNAPNLLVTFRIPFSL